MRHGDLLRSEDTRVPGAGRWPRPLVDANDEPADAYSRYLLNCSDYLKRQMMIYQHWPQRRYDVLGYRDEKVFTDMNN